VLALLAGGAALVVEAAPPAPSRATVLVLPGPAEAPDRQTVLAPRDLLKQIDALASAGAPRGAVVAGATYEGKAAGDQAEFEAKLLVHGFDDGPATVALPFADVRLQDDALLDGARAFLTAAPAGQTGLLLRVEKPGSHVLVLRFRVPVTANGPEREVRFRAPRVPQSQLTLTVPAGATFFQAPARQGSLAHQEAAPGATAGSRYSVELGRADGPLVFRWHESAGAPPAPALRVTEAYLWDLRPDTASLSAVLHYAVTRGAPTSLVVELPEALEVQAAEARPAEAGRPVPPLDGWRVESADGKRRLRLDFAAPVTGGAYVLLDLVPRRALASPATLPLPVPAGAEVMRGFLAYRAEGVEVRVAKSGRVRGPYAGDAGAAELKAFAALWRAAHDAAPPTPAALYVVQREPGGDPFLDVNLRMAPLAFQGSHEVAWRVGARQADLRAVARPAPGGDWSLVEWEVPADVVVTRVGGREGREPVWHWSRSGTRVQAWLNRTGGAAEVELDGWKELPTEKDGARFDLPGVRLLSAGEGATFVRLTAAPDFGLRAEDTHDLRPLPEPRASEREVSYLARGPVYGGRFRVHPVAAGAEARVLTTVEAVAGELAFTAHVEYRPDRAGGRGLEVRLRNWTGDVRLDAPAGARRPEARRAGDERSWVIDLPAGPAVVVTLTLSGTMPLPAAGAAAPDVTLPGAARVERWLVAGGPGLTAEGAVGLSAVPAGPRAGADLPAAGRAEAARLQGDGGTLWKVEGAGWALRLRPRRRPDGSAVRVALTEYTAAVVDGRRWAHEAVVWLYHEANTDLNVSLPEGARVLGVTVDGLAVTPLQASAEGLWVPLPGAAGARRVRLRWAFDPESEPLDRPRLQRPQLHGADDDGPVAWTVHVPAEYAASFPGDGPHGRVLPSGPAALDLARAEAQYRLSASLAEGASAPPTALALTQRRFYRFCRYVESGRLLTGHGAGPANWQGQGFDEALQELKEKNRELARQHKFEKLRERAEQDAAAAAPAAPEPAAPDNVPELAGVGMVQAPGPRGDPLPERGTPLRWQTGPKADAPSLLLTPLAERQAKRAAGASLLLAVLLVLAWALAHFPGVLAWVRAFWPEQVALLGCLGWQTYGPALPLLFLIVLGVTARPLFLGRRLLALVHRPAAAGSHVGSSAPGTNAEPRPSGT
jgi:hypothetical protein